MFTMVRTVSVVNPAQSGDQVNRRERMRAQTRDEILRAARSLVAAGDDLSMRVVARAVGMTAPGLYRYVEGHDDLLDLLGGALYDELIGELASARDAVDADDLPARLVAMAHAFRRWALDHRHEYGLLFANPLAALSYDGRGGCTREAGERFGGTFAEVFAAMWQRGLIEPPDVHAVDPALLGALERGDKGAVDLPLSLRYVFVRQWARLYGMVTLEAFGHLAWAMDDGAALFEAMLAESLAELGFEVDGRARPARSPT